METANENKEEEKAEEVDVQPFTPADFGIHEMSSAINGMIKTADGSKDTADDDGDDHDQSPQLDDIDLEDLPDALIVTNLPRNITKNLAIKERFENMLRSIDPLATVAFFPSFNRARIQFSNKRIAAKVRIRCHNTSFGGNVIGVYFHDRAAMREVEEGENYSRNLRPPKAEKQFLISPPASPPVGWEPITEQEPSINFELLSALARLVPGGATEIVEAQGSAPSIVIHACTQGPEEYMDEEDFYDSRTPKVLSRSRSFIREEAPDVPRDGDDEL